MKDRIIDVVALAIARQSGEAREITFSSPPEVTQDGDGARIEFTAGTRTDCAVYILDRSGKIRQPPSSHAPNDGL